MMRYVIASVQADSTLEGSEDLRPRGQTQCQWQLDKDETRPHAFQFVTIIESTFSPYFAQSCRAQDLENFILTAFALFGSGSRPRPFQTSPESRVVGKIMMARSSGYSHLVALSSGQAQVSGGKAPFNTLL